MGFGQVLPLYKKNKRQANKFIISLFTDISALLEDTAGRLRIDLAAAQSVAETAMVTAEASVPLRRSKQHNKNNFLIHQLYLRQVCSVSS